MNQKLNYFTSIITNPYQSIAQWKQQNNKKVIGCVPMHIPEEIIHAAGVLPVVLWESDEPITLANSHIQSSICGFPRSIFDDAIKDRLNFIDGMVFCDCCLANRALAFLIERNTRIKYLRTIYLPQLLDGVLSKDHLVNQLERFKVSLEEFSGKKITNVSIRNSIATYNQSRALLRKLYDLRRRHPGMLKAKEVLAVVMSGMLMLKEEHNELLKDLLAELEKQKTPAASRRSRLILSGSLCQAPRFDILDIIEDAGGVVVDDDLYVGSRYMITDARVDIDPLEALAERFLKMQRRCPTKSQKEADWAKQLVELAQKSKAKGVISLQVKFCEPHYFYYGHIINTLDKAGIPELAIEMEHEATSIRSAQITTRVQAFIESIEGRK